MRKLFPMLWLGLTFTRTDASDRICQLIREIPVSAGFDNRLTSQKLMVVLVRRMTEVDGRGPCMLPISVAENSGDVPILVSLYEWAFMNFPSYAHYRRQVNKKLGRAVDARVIRGDYYRNLSITNRQRVERDVRLMHGCYNGKTIRPFIPKVLPDIAVNNDMWRLFVKLFAYYANVNVHVHGLGETVVPFICAWSTTTRPINLIADRQSNGTMVWHLVESNYY